MNREIFYCATVFITLAVFVYALEISGNLEVVFTLLNRTSVCVFFMGN